MLQTRGPSKRARIDTNIQYTAPMTVITLKSDERNIWKTKQGVHTHRCRSSVCFRFSSSSLQHLVTALSLCSYIFFPLFVGVHMSMVLVHVCVSVFCTFMCVRVHEGCKPEAEIRCLPLSLSILQLVFEAVSVTGPGAE